MGARSAIIRFKRKCNLLPPVRRKIKSHFSPAFGPYIIQIYAIVVSGKRQERHRAVGKSIGKGFSRIQGSPGSPAATATTCIIKSRQIIFRRSTGYDAGLGGKSSFKKR